MHAITTIAYRDNNLRKSSYGITKNAPVAFEAQRNNQDTALGKKSAFEYSKKSLCKNGIKSIVILVLLQTKIVTM